MTQVIEKKSDRLEKIQNKNNSFINSLENLRNILDFDDKEEISSIIRHCLRLNEESKRGLYFVTIQGSLKTGKSTLTNLFIKDDVAITKSGQDTTKTPYVITRAHDGQSKIVIYSLSRNIKGDKQKQEDIFRNILEAIMDDIKGLKFENPYKSYFNKKIEPLDRRKIYQYTVEKSIEEAIFINIQIAKKDDENNLLDNEIAILDTPGIEGLKAKRHQKIIEEVKKRTNMLVVMQSTVTPINSNELEELKEYLNEEAEIRLLHNKFELKPWASEYDMKKLKEEEESSIQKAKEIIMSELNVNPISNSFNLAKVYDYMRNKEVYKNLENDYKKFQEFNNELIFTINRIKIESREKKAYKQFKNLLDDLLSSDSVLLKLKEKYKNIIDIIDNKTSEIEEQFESVENSIKEFFDVFESKYKRKVEELFENHKIKSELKVTNPNIGKIDFFNSKAVKQVKKEIEEFVNNLKEEINNLYKVNVLKLLKEEYKEEFINVVYDLKEFLNKKDMNKFAIKISDIYFSENVVPNIIKDMNIDAKALMKTFVTKGGGLLGFRNRIIETEKLEKHIQKLFEKEVKNNFKEFWKKLKSNIYNGVNGELDIYIKNLENIKKEVLNYYNTLSSSRKLPAQQAVSEIETLLFQIKDARNRLK